MKQLLKKLKKLDKLNKECQEQLQQHESELTDKLLQEHNIVPIAAPQYMLICGTINVIVPIKHGAIAYALDNESNKFEQLF